MDHTNCLPVAIKTHSFIHWSEKLHFDSTSFLCWSWVKISRSIWCTGLRKSKRIFIGNKKNVYGGKETGKITGIDPRIGGGQIRRRPNLVTADSNRWGGAFPLRTYPPRIWPPPKTGGPTTETRDRENRRYRPPKRTIFTQLQYQQIDWTIFTQLHTKRKCSQSVGSPDRSKWLLLNKICIQWSIWRNTDVTVFPKVSVTNLVIPITLRQTMSQTISVSTNFGQHRPGIPHGTVRVLHV